MPFYYLNPRVIAPCISGGNSSFVFLQKLADPFTDKQSFVSYNVTRLSTTFHPEVMQYVLTFTYRKEAAMDYRMQCSTFRF